MGVEDPNRGSTMNGESAAAIIIEATNMALPVF